MTKRGSVVKRAIASRAARLGRVGRGRRRRHQQGEQRRAGPGAMGARLYSPADAVDRLRLLLPARPLRLAGDAGDLGRPHDDPALARRGGGAGRGARPSWASFREAAAREIARKARVELLDLRAMKRDFDVTWNPVMPLVDALRARAAARAPARWVHWGATSKNIMDTGTALQIRDSYAVVLARAGRDRRRAGPARARGTATR